jgi:hypothetical protein
VLAFLYKIIYVSYIGNTKYVGNWIIILIHFAVNASSFYLILFIFQTDLFLYFSYHITALEKKTMLFLPITSLTQKRVMY